jgi:hypothetical protein
MPFRLISCLLLALLAAPALASGFDRAAFERLDPEQLRAAEARVHELLEPGTARLLREPANDAEAYVVARQQRLAEKINRPPQSHHTADGSLVTEAFWPNARATRVSVDNQGQVQMLCVGAAEMLGHRPPDFRYGNLPQEQRQ